MDSAFADKVTLLLKAAVAGDSRSAEELLPLVYDQLRQLARVRMRKLGPDQTLQPTALVHEVYLKLVGVADSTWEGRDHFFAAAAQAMRHILVDQARRKARIKHGAQQQRIALDQDITLLCASESKFLELDEALTALESYTPRPAKLVGLRCFAGLTMDQAAHVLGISVGTAHRDWTYAKAWLRDRLSDPDTDGGSDTAVD